MEAVPRLPMISFELKVSTENASFSQPLKQYITQCYGEDPESYNNEIHNLESLRGGAVRPSIDVEGIQLLKKYYCQLHFLKSRFPMEELQPAAVYFSWKDNYSSLACSIPDIRFELMCILYNIGALHTQLGAADQRTTPDGMKIACTHFQCAAWAFQVLKENYYQMITYISSVEIIHFMELVCLAQAQECILEKSMMDNRKATIIAKVAVQVVEYYKKAQLTLQGGVDETNYSDYIQIGIFKDWVKYLNFKVAYHKCISLLFQGQQAEEQQKMGERVALYQAAADQLEAARKLSSGLDNKQDITEALAFTSDVVEGKKKAAKNENDFIYHEEVPNKDRFEEVKGASLVKGIPFNITDPEVSGQDIFARLIPIETHEASSLYSEKKAELLRKYGELIESKDQKLAEFMSSMQIDFLNDIRQATGIPQDIVDRAAALSAKPNAIQDLVSSMTKLSNSYHEVESLLNEIQELLKEEDMLEKEYQKSIGERPPSIISTDLSREAAKYREAHSKANQSNQNLHRAMMVHVGNLKTLSQPLTELQQQIPAVKLPDPNIDESSLKEIEMLLAKVEEMKTQRGVLWAQLRDALHTDDITSVLVTRDAKQSLDDVFQQELDKHKKLTSLIEQNAAAQENIIKAFIDAYAKFSNTRRFLHGVVSKRQSTINALVSSYDSYEDLLAKATKGVEFYTKLETNVTKLLQRIKSSCKVQQEEREQMLAKVAPVVKPEQQVESNAPKLKDYLDSMKTRIPKTTNQAGMYAGNLQNPPDTQVWPPGIRPTPVGSEIDDSTTLQYDSSNARSKDSFMYAPTNPVDMYHPEMTVSTEVLEKKMSGLAVGTKDQVSYQPQNYGYYNYASYDNNYLNTGEVPITSSQVNVAPSTNASFPQYAAGNIPVPATSAYGSQYTQYIPTHYQQTDHLRDNASSVVYDQNVYASGYATGQNYHNSAMATVQSGGYSSYGGGTLTPSDQSRGVFSHENTYNVSGTPKPETTVPHPHDSLFKSYQEHLASGVGSFYTQNFGQYAQNSTEPLQSSNNLNYHQNSSFQSPLGQQLYNSFGQTPVLPQYSEGYVGAGTLVFQNQINPNSMYTQAGMNYVYQLNNTPSSNGGLTSSLCQPNTEVQVPNPTPKAAESSTIDLLSGLDFSISQVPLEPELKKISELKTDQNTASVVPVAVTVSASVNVRDDTVDNVKTEVVAKVIPSKSLDNQETKRLFQNEIDKYEKFVDVLSHKTLNGLTTLDMKWKEIQDKQESDGTKKNISVARCYPVKNRFPDILPYDHSRVVLRTTADDYINASFIKDISPYVPPIIVTQAPLQSTIVEFWSMILEQRVEFIMCLLNENEIDQGTYWPIEKGNDINVANLVVSLQSIIVKKYWTERIIAISVPEKREFSTVVHLQFTNWPGSSFPATPDSFIAYIREFIGLYQQQKLHSHPMVIHCLSGIGRSGVACLMVYAILEAANNSATLPDLTSLTNKITSFRKNILRDREHLKFAYQAFLCYMKQILSKNGDILNTVSSNIESNVSEKSREDDPLSSLDPFWASKKDNK